MDNSDVSPLPSANKKERVFAKIISFLFGLETIPTWLLVILLNNSVFGIDSATSFYILLLSFLLTFWIPGFAVFYAKRIYKNSNKEFSQRGCFLIEALYFLLTFLYIKIKQPQMLSIWQIMLLLPVCYKIVSALMCKFEACVYSLSAGVLLAFAFKIFMLNPTVWLPISIIICGALMTSRLILTQTTIKSQLVGLASGIATFVIFLIIINV
ncbi:MAG: hypothetical protein HUK18_03985 [Bacteroidales bacterium]|nr:hypothetical protein [Bacteroidales bacterium]